MPLLPSPAMDIMGIRIPTIVKDNVAIRCDGCVAFHAEAAVKQGATRDEIMETMGMAVYMGAGPSVMYAAQAVEAYDQFAAKKAAAA